MQQRYLGLFAFVVLGLVACAENGPEAPKTPDQLLADQERLGDEQLKRERTENNQEDTSGSTEEEKRREWDDKQADLEMHRAAHSAETCPDSVTEDAPTAPPVKGAKPAKKAPPKAKDTKASVTLVFANDGHVKSLSVGAPYDENAVGKCVQRALNAVIVPAFNGDEHTLDWEIDLTGAKKSGPVGKTDSGTPTKSE